MYVKIYNTRYNLDHIDYYYPKGNNIVLVMHGEEDLQEFADLSDRDAMLRELDMYCLSTNAETMALAARNPT